MIFLLVFKRFDVRREGGENRFPKVRKEACFFSTWLFQDFSFGGNSKRMSESFFKLNRSLSTGENRKVRESWERRGKEEGERELREKRKGKGERVERGVRVKMEEKDVRVTFQKVLTFAVIHFYNDFQLTNQDGRILSFETKNREQRANASKIFPV